MAKKKGKNLVIVESPAKAKTINKYLGDDYIVKAHGARPRSPTKGMGVDLKTFEPEYEILESRGKVDQRAQEARQGQRPTSTWRPTWTARARPSPGTSRKRWASPTPRPIASSSTPSPRAEIQKAFSQPAWRSTWTASTPSRPGASSTASSAMRSRRCCGGRSPRVSAPGACRAWRCGWSSSASGRSKRSSRKNTGRSAAIFSTDRRRMRVPSCRSEWIDFLTNTGNGERTKHEREKWLADHDAFVAELVELAGKKFEAGNKDEARKAAELLGFVVDEGADDRRRRRQGPGEVSDDASPASSANCPTFTVRVDREEAHDQQAAGAVHHQHAPAGARPAGLGFGRQRHDAAGPDAVRGRAHHLHAYRLDEPVRARR